jgi:hypothetical protein
MSTENEFDTSPDAKYWFGIIGAEEGRMVWRSAPLSPGGAPYWHAAARISTVDGRMSDAALALRGPVGEPRRLSMIEAGLVSGELDDADKVLDAVIDLIECQDDEYGTARAKSYLAGWLCADVVGRCLS